MKTKEISSAPFSVSSVNIEAVGHTIMYVDVDFNSVYLVA